MRESVPTAIYSPVCNVLRQWKTSLILTLESTDSMIYAKKRPNTSGVGKINNYYEDIYIPPYNNTD